MDSQLLQRIGLHSDTGFPYEAYCFTDGQMAVQMERNGGLNELNFLSIWETPETFHIERYMLPILSKRHVKGYSYGLYGPVMRFVSTGTTGRDLYHIPDQVSFLPFGFASSSERFGARAEYSLTLQDRCAVFSFRNEAADRQALEMLFCTPGLAKGEFTSWIVPSGREIDYSTERRCVLRWDEVRFDDEDSCLYATGEVFRYIGPGETVCIALAASRPASLRRQEHDQFILSAPWDKEDELHYFLIFEDTPAACRKRLAELRQNPHRPRQEQTERYAALAREIPALEVGGHPAAADMARTIPLFVQAMKLHPRGKPERVANRAATFKFGYFPHWDVLWTVRSILLWGQYDYVRRSLAHSLTYYARNGWSHQAEFQVLLAEYYALTRDRKTLETCFQGIRPIYLATLAKCDAKGFLFGGQYGADDPAQHKLRWDGYFSPEGIAWLFNGTRAMENMAMILGDVEVEEKSRSVTDRIRTNYLPCFWDKRVDYLCKAVDADTGRQVDVYQNVATMAMEGPYGELLVDDVMGKLAAFQRQHLYHPSGRSACPFWDRADEMWKSCIMLQHANHEMLTSRHAGDSEELLRMWKVYLDLFDRCKLQIETINLCGMPGDPTGQRADWQAFGSSAQYGILVRSVVGLEPGYRSLAYVPCSLDLDISLRSFRHGESSWDIAIQGSGGGIESFVVDGQAVQGSLCVPSACFDGGHHTLAIRRGPRLPSGPCVLRAFGAGVSVLHASDKRLEIRLDGTGRVPVRFHAPCRPTACTLDGKEIAFEWNEAKKTGLADVAIRDSARLELILPVPS